jgi:hypothetical protein
VMGLRGDPLQPTLAGAPYPRARLADTGPHEPAGGLRGQNVDGS